MQTIKQMLDYSLNRGHDSPIKIAYGTGNSVSLPFVGRKNGELKYCIFTYSVHRNRTENIHNFSECTYHFQDIYYFDRNNLLKYEKETIDIEKIKKDSKCFSHNKYDTVNSIVIENIYYYLVSLTDMILANLGSRKDNAKDYIALFEKKYKTDMQNVYMYYGNEFFHWINDLALGKELENEEKCIMKKEALLKIFNSNKNLIVEGDIASGKTINTLFPVVDNAIENNESLFVLDSKEEYINKYYEKLIENNYNVIIINLREMEKSEGWNPLEYPYNLYKNGEKDRAHEYLDKIGKIMFYENNSQDPFWSNTASDLFTGITFALFEDATDEEINLNSVNNILAGYDKKYGVSNFLSEYFKAKDTTSKSYIFASSTICAPKETQGSIVSVAKQKLRLYVSNEKLSQIMNKTTFNFDDIINKKTAIFVISRDENKSLNTVAAMFIEQLYSILVDSKEKNKFNFILDNFDNIEKCNDLIDILDSCISRNIKTYIATRSLLEFTKNYGNYITKLCDIASIKDKKLTFNKNKDSFDINFETMDTIKGNVKYPKLNNVEIKMFDLKEAIKNIKLEQINNNKNNNHDCYNIDEMIKNIDKTIEKLENEK